ncbi:MAG: hypothetical protein ACREL5_15115 [Gemmatimonadales bacterium]
MHRTQCLTAVGSVVLALVGAGCSSGDSTAGPPPDITLSQSSAWAGSSVTVRSAIFAGDTAPSVWFDTSAMAVTRVDDTTLRVAIPATFGGSYDVTARSAAQPIDVGQFVVYGAGPVQNYGVTFYYNPSRWPYAAHASVAAFTSTSLAALDLVTGAVSTFPGMSPGAMHLDNPGYTSLDSVFVVGSTSLDSVELWRIGAPPSRVAVAALPGPGVLYDALMPAPGAWWVFHQEYIHTPAGCTTIYGPDGFDHSPSGNRLVVLATGVAGFHTTCPYPGPNTVLDGTPVFDAATGQLAFTVPEIQNATGDAFSADGQLLALTGGNYPLAGVDYPSPGRLTVVDASTGAVRFDTLLDSPAWSVLFDDKRAAIYVLVTSGSTRSVIVLDRSTMRVEGVMQAPDGAGDVGLLVMGSAEDSTLYALFRSGPAEGWRFALPSARLP